MLNLHKLSVVPSLSEHSAVKCTVPLMFTVSVLLCIPNVRWLSLRATNL